MTISYKIKRFFFLKMRIELIEPKYLTCYICILHPLCQSPWPFPQNRTKSLFSQSFIKILSLISSNIQSIPFNKFSPVIALQFNALQWCVFIASKPSNSPIFSTGKAPSKSCLLANTSNVAPIKRSS